MLPTYQQGIALVDTVAAAVVVLPPCSRMDSCCPLLTRPPQIVEAVEFVGAVGTAVED